MSDVFQEVDEELREEKYKSIWRKFRYYVIGGLILFILGIAANAFWKNYNLKEINEARKAVQPYNNDTNTSDSNASVNAGREVNVNSNNEAGDDSSGQNTTCESVICTEPLVKQGTWSLS